MNPFYFLRALFLALCLSAIPASGFAQAQPAQDYKPEVGQEGKDVVWVPTPQALVDKMLDLAKVTPKDYVIDLGFRRRPHRDHRCQTRRQGARHRIQPGDGRAVET